MPTITTKGQVTLPKAIREALGLYAGSEVEFAIEEGKVVLKKRAPAAAFRKWEGRLYGRLPGESVDETLEMLRGESLKPEVEEE